MHARCDGENSDGAAMSRTLERADAVNRPILGGGRFGRSRKALSRAVSLVITQTKDAMGKVASGYWPCRAIRHAL